jgi:2-succinyl-5-enolpyruvyl-6-hydroxy-3-cyclohexene-1-carboxylate synthase
MGLHLKLGSDVFRNSNELWSYVLAETLCKLGLKLAVICPGSRSTPLVVAFAQKINDIEVISILDERSAAFFALGRAKVTGVPSVIICTSGTAAANFYPAVVEAKESRIPLILLTADRPPELRNCHSGQTINQVRLYGDYPNWQVELALPVMSMEMLGYLRQTVVYAWEKTLTPVAGAVHLNIPLRDPLAPIADESTNITPQPPFLLKEGKNIQFQGGDFFSAIQTYFPTSKQEFSFDEGKRGVIIAGVAQPQNPEAYCNAIALLAKSLNYPVLAEGLSPVRNYAHLNPNIISTYDLILRNPHLTLELTPEVVIQIGDIPTSKELRTWLTTTQPQRWIIDPSDQNLDPLHGKTTHIRVGVEDLVGLNEGRRQEAEGRREFKSQLKSNLSVETGELYLQLWLNAEKQVRQRVDETFAKIDYFLESKISWLLPQILPPNTPIFIANSMPVRDVEFFWQPNNSQIKPFFNRGANGIDGTLSTALGVMHRQSGVMLTGDLALLHDTNGFLIRKKFIGHLTIILINNNGGGIFEMLPISQFEPPFEEFFATPQDINFAQLAATYGVEYELISSWQQLAEKLNPLPQQGIRILEIPTNRKADAKWRKDNLGKFG